MGKNKLTFFKFRLYYLINEKPEEKAVEIARALAPENWGGRRCLHFSFLFRKNKLLAIGQNSTKTHARNRYNCAWDLKEKKTCSEMALFVKAKNTISDLKWEKMTIVNIRLGRDGQLSNSRPCAACQNLIHYLQVGKVLFSTENGFEKY